MLSRERRDEIISSIEQAREMIVERLVDEMYKNPFWEERYGKLGKAHARQDVNYHLDNLTVAIRVEMLSSPVNYYRYLRNILVHRGISTYHIRQTLDLLCSLLKGTLPDEWPEIEPYLKAGYEGLACEHPACLKLSNQREEIAQAVVQRLSAPPEEISTKTGWLQARFQEILLHLSYLQDAVDKDSPEIFENHARWSSDYYPSKGVRLEIIFEEWKRLSEEIQFHLDPQEARPFQDLLTKGLSFSNPH